jgi:hypothetical protein
MMSEGTAFRKNRNRDGTPAIALVEEAVHLLRLSPLSLVAPYYIGSLPFLLGLLYYWADMSRSPMAFSICARAAFGMAILYLWMKCWHAAFARRLLARLTGEPVPPWTIRRVLDHLEFQAIVQPAGLFALPFAALLTVPFAWTAAFFENLTVLGDGREGLKAATEKAWRQARLWTGQNHLLLSILCLFGLFVFLNVVLALVALPFLVRSLFGIETVFLSGPWYVLNTTFFAASAGIAWLCIDPLVKAAYVLRCFYGDSLRSAADLKAELKAILPVRGAAAGVLILVAVIGACPAFPAESPASRYVAGVTVSSGSGVSPAELDRAVDEVIRKREYAWRMPREARPDRQEEKGFLASLVASAVEYMNTSLQTIGEWGKRFLRWWGKLFPDRARPEPERDPIADRAAALQVLLFALLALASCLLAIVFLRSWRHRRSEEAREVPAAADPVTDLSSENLSANQYPSSDWLDLAADLARKGDLRLSLRALYLAGLSHLARSGLIVIARFKSNREYERELRRRVNGRAELAEAFSENVATFDRTWYGMHRVDGDLLRRFRENLDRIMDHAKR